MRNQQQNNDRQDAHTKKMTIMMKSVPPYKPEKKTMPIKKSQLKKQTTKVTKRIELPKATRRRQAPRTKAK